MDSVLSEKRRQKLDTSDDDAFYAHPRFVTHADAGFVAELTSTYDDLLADGDSVFDAMSSWVSHLPEREYDRVVGHGLNAEELEANDRLDSWFVQNLNEEQTIPLDAGGFELVTCALSVQYLQYPAAVFGEFARLLSPGGHLVVSFTNRMFPTKAISAWRTADMDGRVALVESYCDTAGLAVEAVRRGRPESDPFVAVVARNEA